MWGQRHTENTSFDPPVSERIATANHDSVTESVLTNTRKSRFLRRDKGWLHREPLISYLNDGEQPHFILESTASVNSGVHGSVNPEPPYRAFCCLTGQRVLFLIGRDPENEAYSVALSSIQKISITPGLEDPDEPNSVGRTTTRFYPTIRVETNDEFFEFLPSDGLNIADIEAVGDHIVGNTSLSDWVPSNYWSQVEERQRQKVKHWNERKRKEREERKKRREEARRRRELEQLRTYRRLEQLVDSAPSTTVTVERLSPMEEYLDSGELVLYILVGGQRRTFMRDSSGNVSHANQEPQDWSAVTTSRVLVSARNGVETIDYSGIRAVDIHCEEGDPSIQFLHLILNDLAVSLDASELTNIHLQQLVNEIRGQIS